MIENKFKIGDYVKIINPVGCSKYIARKQLNRIGRIINIFDRTERKGHKFKYYIELPEDLPMKVAITCLFADEELELATKEEAFLEWGI